MSQNILHCWYVCSCWDSQRCCRMPWAMVGYMLGYSCCLHPFFQNHFYDRVSTSLSFSIPSGKCQDRGWCCHLLSSFLGCAQAPSNGFPSSFVPFYFLSFLMLIYSFITDYQAFNLRYKDNTTRDKNETKVGKQLGCPVCRSKNALD